MIGADQLVAVAVAVLGAAAAIWLVIVNARHQVRVLGVIGILLILLGVITRFAFHWIGRRYLGVLQSDVIVSILAADLVVGGVLTGLGMLLLTRALIVAS